MADPELLPGDLLIGARAIAEALGVKPRQVYHLLYEGDMPSFKLGGNVAARRSKLAKWLEEKERG